MVNRMGAFSGINGKFILTNAVKNVRIELFMGNISKQKAYVIAKGAPNNEVVQNVALAKSNNMSVNELKIFIKILLANLPNKKEI